MANKNAPLRKRLLQDIAELQSKPYPNVSLFVQDEDITKACLILTVENYGPMHMTVEFPANYPLQAPRIQMNSNVHHPNIFGSYICASILNTQEGYTPAYTLKGIAIQMLSFFSSDKIEQTGGGSFVDLKSYKDTQSYIHGTTYKCDKCRHGILSNDGTILARVQNLNIQVMPPVVGEEAEVHWPSPEKSRSVVGRSPRQRNSSQNPQPRSSAQGSPYPHRSPSPDDAISTAVSRTKTIQTMKLPDEILLLICEQLDTEDLMMFAEAWQRIGTTMTRFDVIRTRELQCFCFKKDYMSAKLGVGVSLTKKGRMGFIESEFDLLSYEGFFQHHIRRSVQGVPFENWLPLPISNGHWRKIQGDVALSLQRISEAASLGAVPNVEVVFRFMNDVVVKLNQQASQETVRAPYNPYGDTAKSTLTHASEKAIESYFHLFHLLLCLATSQPGIVQAANRTLQAFGRGETSKEGCPNLGHLLVASLISDVEMTDGMIKAIVKETITRNVVWMLDSKGSGMAELSYLEPSEVSEYRLQKTFEASKTSYRLLMFLNLFRKTAVGNPRKPLNQLRDEAFERHGAPPRGSAKGLANSIKRIHQVNCFPEFLVVMGVGKPSAGFFTKFLRECVEASVVKGYSRMPVNQNQALFLRQQLEPNVEVKSGMSPTPIVTHNLSFFPNGAGGNRGGSRGRGDGRGGRGGQRGQWRGGRGRGN